MHHKFSWNVSALAPTGQRVVQVISGECYGDAIAVFNRNHKGYTITHVVRSEVA